MKKFSVSMITLIVFAASASAGGGGAVYTHGINPKNRRYYR